MYVDYKRKMQLKQKKKKKAITNMPLLENTVKNPHYESSEFCNPLRGDNKPNLVTSFVYCTTKVGKNTRTDN